LQRGIDDQLHVRADCDAFDHFEPIKDFGRELVTARRLHGLSPACTEASPISGPAKRTDRGDAPGHLDRGIEKAGRTIAETEKGNDSRAQFLIEAEGETAPCTAPRGVWTYDGHSAMM
jgi:hypothetical protein